MIFDNSEEEFLKKVKPELEKIFLAGERIAIKLHMGERGNKTHISAEFTKKIVSILKENKVECFLFDSPVMYPGGRNTPEKYLKTAAENGFSEKDVGCPIIISNDFEYVGTEHINAEVCKPLVESDGILVLSHVKGHMCSGIGGAIKNLGMGGVSTKTKADIHNFANPIMVGDCSFCKACVKACPVNAITAKTDKVSISYDSCWGCGVCVDICPQNCLKPKKASFDTLISEAAFAIISSMRKSYYINVLTKITKLCDCMAANGPIVSPDIGYLASDDIVEIEKKSVDLINEKAGENIFLKILRKDPYKHISEIERLMKATNK